MSERKPDAYAVKNDQGYYAGIWRDLETAKNVLSKGQPSHNEVIVPMIELAKFKENAGVYRTRIINAIHMLDAGHTKKQVRLHLSIIHDETMTEAK